jgi:hypothetical protein
LAEAKAGVGADGTRIEAVWLPGDGFVAVGCHAQPSFFRAK